MLNRGPKVIKVDFEIIHESIWKVGGSLLNYEIGSHQQSSRILGEVSQRSWKFPESLACNLVDVTAFIWINHPNLWGLACKYYSSWWLKDENTCCFQANKRSCCHLTHYFFFFCLLFQNRFLFQWGKWFFGSHLVASIHLYVLAAVVNTSQGKKSYWKR